LLGLFCKSDLVIWVPGICRLARIARTRLFWEKSKERERAKREREQRERERVFVQGPIAGKRLGDVKKAASRIHLMSHMHTPHVTHAHPSCHTCTPLMSHMHTPHATHAHPSCHTCTPLMPNMHTPLTCLGVAGNSDHVVICLWVYMCDMRGVHV